LEEINPYAAPENWDYTDAQITGAPLDEVGNQIGAWRDGRLLVMHKQARLPDRCVKSNAPTSPDQRWRHKFTWCHPAVLFTVLINFLVLFVAYLIFRKQATIEVGIMPSFLDRRRRAMTIGWLLMAGGIVGLIAGIVVVTDMNADTSQWGVPAMLVSAIVILLGAGWAGFGSRIVTCQKMNKHYVWLRGVHPDYLETLPDWSGE